MKRLAMLALVCTLASLGHSDGNRFYVQGGVFPLEFSGLKDVAVSDWQNYGTGPAEGRIRLPLSQAKANGMVPGFSVGVDREFIPKLTGLFEVQGGIATGSFPVIINVGAGWTAYNNERFTLKLVPKVGYAVGSVDFGTAKVIPGKTAPVITPQGTIYNGASITASVSGVAVQAGVNATYMFTDQLGLTLDVAYVNASLADFQIKAGDVKLNKDSPALVKDDGGTTQAGIDPKASIGGLIANIGIVWRFF